LTYPAAVIEYPKRAKGKLAERRGRKASGL